jgi:hypothetical protein
MSRRSQERAALRALQRRVWGNGYYEQHVVELARGRQRRVGLLGIAAGAQMMIVALALFVFPSAASAHTSQITITCTKVTFDYASFPDVAVTAHESVVIDGQQGPSPDFEFTGPTATNSITIDLHGPQSHTVKATTNWTFSGQPQGSAELTQELDDCSAPSTSTSIAHETTTTHTTSTSVPHVTTTVPASTTTRPASTTTSSTISGETTTIPVGPQGSTTTIHASTTTTPVGPQASTTTVPRATTGTLPFTGSSTRPLSLALALLGAGMIASSVAHARRRTTR